IQVFNGHTNTVWCVEYSPFIIKDSICNSNVICSGSSDNTICFWDIRSNKNELYMIKGDEKEDIGIICLKCIVLKKKDSAKDITYDLNLCYGSTRGLIRIWSKFKHYQKKARTHKHSKFIFLISSLGLIVVIVVCKHTDFFQIL
ncbi:WD-repeat protein, partial [Reticulomyxa filosa]